MTLQRVGPPDVDMEWREDRFSTLLVALGTEGMRRLGACGLWLQDIGETALPHVLQFVAVLLAVPCFKLANAFGQLAFVGNQRKLRLLGFEQEAQEFVLQRLNLGRVTNVNEALHEVERVRRRANAGQTQGHRIGHGRLPLRGG